jgi:ABC-2 type transport system permease protein
MSKIWTIFKHEYTRHVLRKRFIFALLSVPLWILLSLGAGFLSVFLQSDSTPVGYVDQSGLLEEIDPAEAAPPTFEEPELRSFSEEAAAQAALDAREIQAYFVVPAGYPEQARTRVIYLEQPAEDAYSQFRQLLRAGLLRGQDPRVANRLRQGANLTIEAIQEERRVEGFDWFKVAAPIVAAIILTVSVFTSGGYLMQAVVEEKENRTMEILATSLSPQQIMTGKVLALLSVGLTQVLVWSAFPLVVLLLASPYLPFLFGVSIDWKLIALIVLTTLPTFVMISALMAAVGATVTESREGQQVSTLITLPVMAPFMLTSLIITNPGGPIPVALSIFPLTAGLTLLLRMAFATVPGWQIALSATLLVLSAVGSLWLAGRLFRMGMLRYGKRMGWKDVFEAAAARRPVQPVEVRQHG